MVHIMERLDKESIRVGDIIVCINGYSNRIAMDKYVQINNNDKLKVLEITPLSVIVSGGIPISSYRIENYFESLSNYRKRLIEELID